MKIIPIFSFLISILIIMIFVIEMPQLKQSESPPKENATNITLEQNTTEQIITPLEFEYECLDDSHCNETAICVYNKCKNLTCDFPYYAQDHKCERLECISNEECKSNQYCNALYHVCMRLYCGYCQYAEEHRCKTYFCCDDYECGSNAICFYHKCLQNPYVIDFQTLLKGNRRTTYRTILDYSILKNFDIGLVIIQNQEELDNINKNILYLNDMIFNDFQNYTILVVLQHGKMPANVNFNRIFQEENRVYVKISTSEAEKGFTDDAWHVIKVRRDSFLEKNNLIFKITPTGKMIVGGEEILYTSILYPADKDGNQGPVCIDVTFREGEEKDVVVAAHRRQIHMGSIEYVSGKEYMAISVDGMAFKIIEEGNNTKIGDIRIYAEQIHYSAKEMGSWAELRICYEDF